MSAIPRPTPPRQDALAPPIAWSTRVGERPALVLALALGLAAFALWTWLVVAEYDTFHNHNFRDFATYTNVLWNTAHGQPYRTDLLRENVSHLAEHVAPILLPLAPLYALLADPRALILLQQAALALSGLPLFLLARRRLGAWAGLLVLAGYYLSPQLADAILFEGFYPVALTTIPLTCGAYLMLTGRPRLGVAVALSALLIEETSGLALIGLGAMLLLRRQFRWGALLGAVATAYLALVTLVVMPHFHLERTLPEGGNRSVDKFGRLLADPLAVAGADLAQRGPGMARWFLLPTAGLPLLAPQVAAASLPTSAVLLFGNEAADFPSHRITPAIPLAWVATVEGLALLRGGWRLRAGLGLLAVGTLAAFLGQSALPGGPNYAPSLVQPDAASDALARVVAAIPPEAPVGATRDTAVHLANRADIWLFPLKYARATKPALTTPDWWVINLADPEALEDIRQGDDSPLDATPHFGLWLPGGDILVATVDPPRGRRPADALFGGALRLESYTAIRAERSVGLRLVWRVTGTPPGDLERSASLIAADGARIAEQTGPASGEYFPTRRWQAGQVVVEDLHLPLPAAPTTIGRVEVRWREAASGRPVLLADGAPVLALSVEQR